MSRFRGLLMILILLTGLTGCGSNKAVSTVNQSPIPITATPPVTVTPTATPSPTPTPIQKATATILSAGDVIMHDALIRSGKQADGRYSYSGILDEIKPYTDQADFSIISFEGVALDSDKNYTGYPLFNAPPAILSAFAEAGFDMVNTGNNHCLDRKLPGLLETRNFIRQFGMQTIGTYQDSAEPRHKIHDLNGIKVGFLSYTYGCNMNENLLTQEERDAHLSIIDNEKIKSEVEALSPIVDTVVVLLHWGIEYRHEATDAQKKTGG